LRTFFADLIIETLSVGNPLRVQTVYVSRWFVQAEKEPAREVKD